MKKFLIAASVFVAGLTVSSAFAFENQFGGEWRTRAYTQKDFAAKEAADASLVDTRTRLFYTAKFNDKFMLVNKFEMGDQVWGSAGYGKIGADGISVEVKNTYADFTPVDNLNFKIGTQAGVLCRSMLFDDDFSGATMTYDVGSVKIPFMWMKYNEGGPGPDHSDKDMDAYAVSPVFELKNGLSINPMISYITEKTDDPKYTYPDIAGNPSFAADNMDVYFLGLNADYTKDVVKAWFTGIYQIGEYTKTKKDYDVSAYLAAAGAEFSLGQLAIHGQALYASGDSKDDDEIEAFVAPQGQSYYWAEIMGLGMFDNQASNGTCADRLSNVSAFNVGVSFKPMDKLTVGADIWYAMLNEVGKGADDELGTEVDLKAQYMIFENLALDVVGAYLFAGDATGKDDPMEIGTQLELKF